MRADVCWIQSLQSSQPEDDLSYSYPLSYTPPKVSSVMHHQTQDTGIAGHFHLSFLMCLFHKCLLELFMAAAQAAYKSLLLTFRWCRLWSVSSHVLPSSTLTNCLETQLEKDLISCWQHQNFIFQITLAIQIKARILSVPSIAWVERKRTHHLVVLLASQPKAALRQSHFMLLLCFQHKQWYHPCLLSHHLPQGIRQRGKNDHFHQIFSILRTWTPP